MLHYFFMNFHECYLNCDQAVLFYAFLFCGLHVVGILCSVIPLITGQHLTVYFTNVRFEGVVTLDFFITLFALEFLHYIIRVNLAIN